MNLGKIKTIAPPFRVSESFPRGRNSLPRYVVVGLGWEAMRYNSGNISSTEYYAPREEA